jgi:uncharacterized protein
MSASLTTRIAFAAALACGTIGAVPAMAQSAPPSANAVALARELITLKGGNVMFERVVPGVIESAKNSFVPTNPNIIPQLNEVAQVLHKEMEPKRAEIVTEAATVYASRFTEQELKDLVAFYKTPLGRKSIIEEPNAIDASMKRLQVWADELYEKTLSRFRAEMKKKGYEL